MTHSSKNKTHKVFILCLLLLLFGFSNTLSAQSFIDSLQGKNYDELQNIFKNYLKKDTLKARNVARVYVNKAKQEKDTLKIAKGYYQYHYTIDTDKKTQYLDSIILITKNKQNKFYPALAYYKLSYFFLSKKRDLKKTLEYLDFARNYAKKNANIDLLYQIDSFLGIIRSEHLNEKEKAINIFKKCADFYAKQTNTVYQYRYLLSLQSIADTYIGLKKYDSVTYYNNLGYDKACKSNI